MVFISIIVLGLEWFKKGPLENCADGQWRYRDTEVLEGKKHKYHSCLICKRTLRQMRFSSYDAVVSIEDRCRWCQKPLKQKMQFSIYAELYRQCEVAREEYTKRFDAKYK